MKTIYKLLHIIYVFNDDCDIMSKCYRNQEKEGGICGILVTFTTQSWL